MLRAGSVPVCSGAAPAHSRNHPESALGKSHQPSGDTQGKETSRKFPVQEMQRGQPLSSGITLMGHGENRAWGDAFARDGGASADISLWAVQSRHWSSSIECCRDLAQSLIERNHSTLKGAQVKSIATWWGGRAGRAGHWLSPSASSAGRAQAVSMGTTAFPPQEGEVRPAVLCSVQDKAGSNAS